MPTVDRLRADIQRLKARSGPASVPGARAEFAGVVGMPELDGWQRDLLRSEAPRVLLNCCRQSGKSTMSALLGLHMALSAPESLVLVLAPSERQSKELFAKIAAFYRALGSGIPSESYRKLGMELANGSRIEALPGVEKTTRGFSGVDLLLVDEAARVSDGLYYALRPMLAVSGGRLALLSTPYGKRGVFHSEWTTGVGWERYEIPATEVPRIPPEFLAEERRALPERVYRQEYLCSFEEVDDQVFGYEEVAAAMSGEATPLFGGSP